MKVSNHAKGKKKSNVGLKIVNTSRSKKDGGDWENRKQWRPPI
jgi:hypothetical protein